MIVAQTDGSCAPYGDFPIYYFTAQYVPAQDLPLLPSIKQVSVKMGTLQESGSLTNCQFQMPFFEQCGSCPTSTNANQYKVILRPEYKLVLTIRSRTNCNPLSLLDIQFIEYSSIDELNDKLVAFFPNEIGGQQPIVGWEKASVFINHPLPADNDDSPFHSKTIQIVVFCGAVFGAVTVIVIVAWLLIRHRKKKQLEEQQQQQQDDNYSYQNLV